MGLSDDLKAFDEARFDAEKYKAVVEQLAAKHDAALADYNKAVQRAQDAQDVLKANMGSALSGVLNPRVRQS